MRNQLRSTIISGLVYSVGTSAYGAVLYDFSSESSGDLFAGGVTGWTQDSINPSAFDQIFPLAYIATTNFGSGGTNSGHLGTQFSNTPDNSSTTVTGSLSMPNAQSITLNLAILDNDTDAFVGRDAFSVTVSTVGSSQLAQIDFTPNVGDGTLWDLSVGVNGTAVSGTLATVQSNSGYIFQMDFGPTATIFSYGAQGGLADVVFGSRSAVSSFNLGEIAMTHTPVAPAGTSANTLVFDNIEAIPIPEPSSSLLILLGLGVLGRRRR